MDQVQKVVATLCRSIATPRALSIKLLADSGEWAQLQQLSCDPLHYSDPEKYWADVMVTDLLRKANINSGADREARARDTFLLCEKQNAVTNARLSRFVEHGPFEAGDEAVIQFITEWRKEIQSVIGALPLSLTPRFSQGATFGDTGCLTTIPDKITNQPQATPGLSDLLPFWKGTSWERAHFVLHPKKYGPTFVRGNIFFTVPKDGKTRRGCCKEPSLNVSFQLDVGRLLKARLKPYGVDLKGGQQHHRSVAKRASVEDTQATIDLSNASDTMCRLLPKLVLPGQWYELLDSLRSPLTRVDGKWYRLEKFSSMGNGFTFELETLLFCTLAKTLVRLAGGNPHEIMCYGDDLIVPSGHAGDIVAALAFFGFTPNKKKTHVTGYFRESCGGDFFRGVSVRPHIIEELPDEPQHWIALANGLRRAAVLPAWRYVISRLPSAIRGCRGPVHLGDVVLHDEPETWTTWTGSRPPSRWRDCHVDGWEGTWLRSYVPIPTLVGWEHWKPIVQLASCTLLESTGVTPRNSIEGYKFAWLYTSSTLPSTWLPTGPF